MALFLGLVAASVVLATGFAAWPWVVEQYHLRRLYSDDAETCYAAAEVLGKLRSVRAVPRLIELVERRGLMLKMLVGTGSHVEYFSPYAVAICEIGPGALPELRRGSAAQQERSFLVGYIERGEVPEYDIFTPRLARPRER